MNSKSPSPIILLLATLVLQARTVYSCVNLFVAQGQTNGVGATYLNGNLWDGGGGSFTIVCTLSSNPPYNFDCNSGYSAVFNDDADTALLTYSTPHGGYTFATDYFPCGGTDETYCSTWKACRYGCSNTPGDSDCFVYDCGLDYDGCKPGYQSP